MSSPMNNDKSDDRLREPPAPRFDFASLVIDMHEQLVSLRSETTPNSHGHRQKTLFKHSDRTIALFAFEPGAVLAEHSANGTVTIEAIEGELLVGVGGEEEVLRPGQVLVMSPGTRHSVAARVQAGFLLQVSLEP